MCTTIMNREKLQYILEEIVGSRNVYYKPPSNISMKYPAIVYSRDRINNKFADNKTWKQDYSYQIIVIDKDPDSEIVYKVSQMPMCRHDRHYVSDNLNHDVFTLYF